VDVPDWLRRELTERFAAACRRHGLARGKRGPQAAVQLSLFDGPQQAMGEQC
jgi:hypothetical protein